MVESCVYDVINLKNNKTNKKENKYFSNILDANSFFTQNQLEVYNLISNEKLIRNYFYIFTSVEPLEMHSIGDDDEAINNIGKLELSNNLLVQYENKICLPVLTYLNSSKTQVIYYKSLISIFKNVLKAIDTLVSLKIVHNNIYSLNNTTNIIVDTNEETPLLMKFHLSLLLVNENLNEKYLKQFFKVYQPNYIYWPIEIHILCYLLHKLNGTESLSKYNIQQIVSDVFNSNINKNVSNNNVLKTETITFFEKYVNMDRKSVINDILTYYWSWDLFNVSYLFYDIIISKYKQNLFLQLFIKLLLVCQHSIPNKRYTANQCLTNFNKIINSIDIGVFLNVVK